MSVTTETNRVAFVGDGSDNSPYAIPFPLRDEDSVEVFFTTDATGAEASKTRVTDYNITLTATFTTASLTLVTTAPASGETMVVRRAEPATRLSTYSNFDGQPASTLNNDYDKNIMSNLTLQEQLDRAILVAKGHPDANLPLTPLNLIGNAGRNVVVNAGETGFELVAVAGFGLTGSGTADTIPLWTPDGITLGNSLISQSAGNVVVGAQLNLFGNLGVFAGFDVDVIQGNLSVFDGTFLANTTGAFPRFSATLEQTKIGSIAAGVAGIAQFDNFTATDFALSQTSAGATVVNAPTGQVVTIAINAVAALTVSPTIVTATGTLTSNSDADGTTILGRARIGSIGTDTMYVSHFDHFLATEFALLQTPAGSTVLNADIGQTINLSINNVSHLLIQTPDIIIPADDLTLTLGDFLVSGGDITVTAGDVTITAGDLMVGAGGVPRATIETFGDIYVGGTNASLSAEDIISTLGFLSGDNSGSPPTDDLVAHISAVAENAHSSGNFMTALAFYTMTGTTLSEGMRLDRLNNLGIGTIDPLADLHIDMKAASTATTLAGSVFLEAAANAGAGNLGASIIFGGADGASTANLGASITAFQDTADTDTTGLIFRTHGSVGGSPRGEAMRLDSSGNLDVNDKARITPLGGWAVKLTNETGSPTVAGQLVVADITVADAFDTAGASSTLLIGVVLDAGVADGSEAWIVISGIADVLIDAGGAALGDRIVASATAGSADVNNSPSNTVHFTELGHVIEAIGGAGVTRCVLHFN